MNSHERHNQMIELLRERWEESEFRLNFLRSFTGTELEEPTDDELQQWARTTGELCSAWPIPTLR